MIKRMMKAPVAFLLAFFARRVIARYQPKIVMVTGSVGKTSTKDAVAAVLSQHYFVRASEKSYNSEFGMPFTIFGVANPWGNPFAWFAVVRSVLALLVLPNHYPNMLVLEVGADRPGDLAKLLSIATPNAVVVTRLPEVPVHVEAYASPEQVREEEFSPAYALAPGAPLIISSEDPYARQFSQRTAAKIFEYGSAAEATARIVKTNFYIENKTVQGMEVEMAVDGAHTSLVVRGSVGKTQAFPPAAALALAHALKIPPAEALAALSSYTPPPGRARVLSGMHDSVIIDDSYNASPAAVEEVLHTLADFPGATRRVAVLGDMLELGRYSVAEHERIGRLASEYADVVISVGIRARKIAESARSAGMAEDKTLSFVTSHEAATALTAIVQKGDVVLVKGSQSVRTEKIIEALLANPADQALLVRQEPQWKRRGA